ncbi:MAG: alpha/beta fold hydrolase [Clostridiaceae bacterium]|nr:alpha/beta fold hydrolase [Clostridiaceae bacterium]
MQRPWTIKKKPNRKLFWAPFLAVIVFVLIASILVIASSLVTADRLMKQPPDPIPPYAVNVLPSFKSVSFKSGGGQITLKGWLIEAKKDTNRGTVILVHNQGGNRLPLGLSTTSLSKRLSQEGFRVLAFDLRHSGESGGEMSSYGYAEAEDVRAAIDWTIRNIPHSPIILFGFGTGTTGIMRTLHQMEHENVEPTQENQTQPETVSPLDRVSAVVFDSPARDSDAFISAAIKRENSRAMFWLSGTTPYAIRLSIGSSEKLDYFAEFSAISLPVMILGHETDDYLQDRDYRPMIDERLRLHPERTVMYTVPGEGHLTTYEENLDAYIESLLAFMDRWFPKS